METSRKRFYSESDFGSKKRKTRKSKRLLVLEQENNAEVNMDEENGNELNNSTIVASNLMNTTEVPYSEEEDVIIINYFCKNLHLLPLKDDISAYHLLKANHLLDRSELSLQKRFLNHILPNLFKYNVLNDTLLIDFYDAAQLEVPNEYIQLVSERQGIPNLTVFNEPETSVDIVEQAQPNVILSQLPEVEMIPLKSLQSTSSNDVNDATPSTSKEQSFKSILSYIQFDSSNSTSVFIPDTEPNIPEIENKLLNEFGIRKESIKVIPKIRFDLLMVLKSTLEMYDNSVYGVLQNRMFNMKSVEKFLPDAVELFEYLSPFMNKSKRTLQRMSPETSSNIGTKIVLAGNERNKQPTNDDSFNSNDETVSIVDETDPSQLISTLSDSLEQVTIRPNADAPENNYTINIKTEPVETDENVSPYFKDLDASMNLLPTEPNAASDKSHLTDSQMDFESDVIEHACMPQVLFSNRPENENINNANDENHSDNSNN